MLTDGEELARTQYKRLQCLKVSIFVNNLLETFSYTKLVYFKLTKYVPNIL